MFFSLQQFWKIWSAFSFLLYNVNNVWCPIYFQRKVLSDRKCNELLVSLSHLGSLWLDINPENADFFFFVLIFSIERILMPAEVTTWVFIPLLQGIAKKFYILHMSCCNLSLVLLAFPRMMHIVNMLWSTLFQRFYKDCAFLFSDSLFVLAITGLFLHLLVTFMAGNKPLNEVSKGTLLHCII